MVFLLTLRYTGARFSKDVYIDLGPRLRKGRLSIFKVYTLETINRPQE